MRGNQRKLSLFTDFTRNDPRDNNKPFGHPFRKGVEINDSRVINRLMCKRITFLGKFYFGIYIFILCWIRFAVRWETRDTDAASTRVALAPPTLPGVVARALFRADAARAPTICISCGLAVQSSLIADYLLYIWGLGTALRQSASPSGRVTGPDQPGPGGIGDFWVRHCLDELPSIRARA